MCLWNGPILPSPQPKVRERKRIEKNRFLSIVGLFKSSTNDIWGQAVLCCGAVLSSIRCQAVLLASPHWISVGKFIYPSFDNQKWPQALPNLLPGCWGVDSLQLRVTGLRETDPSWSGFPNDNQGFEAEAESWTHEERI